MQPVTALFASQLFLATCKSQCWQFKSDLRSVRELWNQSRLSKIRTASLCPRPNFPGETPDFASLLFLITSPSRDSYSSHDEAFLLQCEGADLLVCLCVFVCVCVCVCVCMYLCVAYVFPVRDPYLVFDLLKPAAATQPPERGVVLWPTHTHTLSHTRTHTYMQRKTLSYCHISFCSVLQEASKQTDSVSVCCSLAVSDSLCWCVNHICKPVRKSIIKLKDCNKIDLYSCLQYRFVCQVMLAVQTKPSLVIWNSS